MLEIEQAISLEHATAVKGWRAPFANNDQAFRYRTLLSIGVNSMQQFTGEFGSRPPRASAQRLFGVPSARSTR